MPHPASRFRWVERRSPADDGCSSERTEQRADLLRGAQRDHLSDGTRLVFAAQGDLSCLYVIDAEGGRPVPLRSRWPKHGVGTRRPICSRVWVGRGVHEGPAGPDPRSPDRSRLALWRRRLEPYDLSDRFGIIEPGHEACLLLCDAAGKLGQDVVGDLERG
jgi:hypothetical protein